MKVVLGYNGGLDGYPAKFGSSHDSAAALVADGVLVAAAEEERFLREKHTGKFPRMAIEYVLREAGLRMEDVDLVTYYFSYPLMHSKSVLAQNKKTLSLFERVALLGYTTVMRNYNKFANYSNERSKAIFEREINLRLLDSRYKAIPHHLCHTASSYYDSPFDSALCLTLDAQGESTSSMAVHARGTQLDVIRETMVPNSLGFLYHLMSTFLGFDRHDEYKVMGLAPYGDPSKHRAFFKTIVQNDANGCYRVDQGLIERLIFRDAVFAPTKMYPRQIVIGLGFPRHPDEPVTQKHMDIAASLQEGLENAVLTDLAQLQKRTGEKNLCLAGGVALNCTMNGKIARSGIFEEIWVHPAAHDAGTSAGAAFFGYYNLLKQPRETIKRSGFQKKTFYLGPGYPESAVRKAVKEFSERIVHSRPTDLSKFVAEQIALGKVVGWYHGRMEWGPRALGNRSILADPRCDNMKDIVNHAIKMREGFRPFAPACLAEKVDDWFDMKGLPDSPYMLFSVPVKEDKRGHIPAVTHVDGSARVQTVTMQQNERFHALLKEFDRQTGVPVLMNTSFNVKGEPIVNTPSDAIRCFVNTQIDLLVLEDLVVEKRPEVTAEIIRRHKPIETGRVVDGQIEVI